MVVRNRTGMAGLAEDEDLSAVIKLSEIMGKMERIDCCFWIVRIAISTNKQFVLLLKTTLLSEKKRKINLTARSVS